MSKTPETIAIHCPHCEKPAMAKIVGRDHKTVEMPSYIIRYTYCICQNCNENIFFKEDGELFAFQNYDGDEQWEEIWDDPDFLYPAQERVFDNSVPRAVKRAYSEANKCFLSGTHTAATIMGRRALEIICAELGVGGEDEKTKKRKDLFQKIEQLTDEGKFAGKVAEWAQRLREIGNIAAHDPKATFSKQQARLTLDFTEALIENSFVLKNKGNYPLETSYNYLWNACASRDILCA